jgi:HlyD family secretion protein
MKAAKPLIVIVSAYLSLCITIGCSKEEANPEPVVSVKAAQVKRAPISLVVNTEAVLYPLQQSIIAPKISAPVKKFYVNRGARVKQGQLLAVLENRDLEAAAIDTKGGFDQAEASYTTTTNAGVPEELQKAELDVQSTKQALDAAQKQYESRDSLFKQGAIPRKDLDQASVALVQARSLYEVAQKHHNSLQSIGKQQELKSAAGQLTSAQGKYLGARAQLGYSEIRSPINGFVTDRPLYAGEMAAQGTPLITVMDLSKVIARAHIPQQEAALLKVGDSATLATQGGVESIPAKLTVVSPALDPNSTTVEVWAEAANPHQTLKPGSTVHLSVNAATIKDALVIPSSALVTSEDGKSEVMVIGPDGRAFSREVKVGVKQGDEVQIQAGLNPGEQIVTVGAYGLPDKTKVKVEAENAQQPAKSSDEGKEE